MSYEKVKTVEPKTGKQRRNIVGGTPRVRLEGLWLSPSSSYAAAESPCRDLFRVILNNTVQGSDA